MRPRRIRMTRTAPWRPQHPEAVIVDRSTKWGNPYVVGQEARTAAEAVQMFRLYLSAAPNLVAAAQEQLAGRDLACWCKLDQPCHADVWLEVANRTNRPNARPSERETPR